MRAVVIDKPGSFAVETVPDPAPRAGEIIVAPRATGICGTDLHIIDGHFPPAPYPLIPGHEFAGEVVDVGAGVDRGLVGSAVAVDPSLFCGDCLFCRRGRGNLCERWGAIGDTVSGAFAEYVAVPAENAYRFDPEMGWSAGALVEPLSCVVHGLRRLQAAPDAEVLVVGAGTIGLLHLQAALGGGTEQVWVLEPDAARRQLAHDLGATQVSDSMQELLDLHGGGFDYVIDATGVTAAIEAGVGALRRGGTLLIFGVAPKDEMIRVSPFTVYNDEISVIGSMAVLNSFAPALDLVHAGAIDVDRLVTDTFELGRFGDAVAHVRAHRGLKTQVVANPVTFNL